MTSSSSPGCYAILHSIYRVQAVHLAKIYVYTDAHLPEPTALTKTLTVRSLEHIMSTLTSETVRRIEDASVALITAGTPNRTNEQVRAHVGGGSL